MFFHRNKLDDVKPTSSGMFLSYKYISFDAQNYITFIEK